MFGKVWKDLQVVNDRVEPWGEGENDYQKEENNDDISNYKRKGKKGVKTIA